MVLASIAGLILLIIGAPWYMTLGITCWLGIRAFHNPS